MISAAGLTRETKEEASPGKKSPLSVGRQGARSKKKKDEQNKSRLQSNWPHVQSR